MIIIYRKIECEAPEEHFHNLDLSVDHNQCPKNVGQTSCTAKIVPCTLTEGHESCWHISICICYDEFRARRFIQLYGVSKEGVNTEYYCIYIRPTEHEPGKLHENPAQMSWT